MRFGQNPAKSIDHVAQPQRVTVAVVTYIPFLSGYYAHSLEVLKACLGSIWENTRTPYDLLVFDNASCPEVRDFLSDAHQQGRIQYLVLSDKNVGKGGAWNFIFGAAPGEYIAYADSDVYFHPGWLSAQLAMFDRFPNLGMVTGAPLRIPEEYSTSTIAWAENTADVTIKRGTLLPWEDWWRHARSLGVQTEGEGRALYDQSQDVCLVHEGQQYFIGAAHFQFIARKSVLQSMLPIPSDRPMGQVRTLDIAVNEKGYLRLTTPEWWSEHMGNTADGWMDKLAASSKELPAQENNSAANKMWSWKPLRRLLVWAYNRIFEILYRS